MIKSVHILHISHHSRTTYVQTSKWQPVRSGGQLPVGVSGEDYHSASRAMGAAVSMGEHAFGQDYGEIRSLGASLRTGQNEGRLI